MNRRSFITTTAVASAGMASMGLKCGGKSAASVVAILTGAASELQILYPNVSALGKIITLANDFNSAWVAGKFDSAKTFFESLDTTIAQVIADLGLNATTRVKLILATLGIVLRVLAALITEQGSEQPKAAAVARSKAPKAVSRVGELADPDTADRLLKTVKP